MFLMVLTTFAQQPCHRILIVQQTCCTPRIIEDFSEIAFGLTEGIERMWASDESFDRSPQFSVVGERPL
jgi:hypothetical protein